jgi:hypothetical protein
MYHFLQKGLAMKLLFVSVAALTFTIGCIAGQASRPTDVDHEAEVRELRESIHFWMKARQDAEK